jgi:acetoin utilization deacetylase AcuC-like enzyme
VKVIYNAEQYRHAPSTFVYRGAVTESKELPARADMLLASVRECGFDIMEARDCGIGPARAVHSRRYLAFLENGHAAWRTLPGASAEIVPNVHPTTARCGYPASIVGRAGFHLSDLASPVNEGTWPAALGGSHAACHAAELVLGGERAAYVLTRPPGHHAGRERAGGFCYINNTAVAAQCLRSSARRVAILDIDVHHGNGTQEIFYRRDDVLHVSVHADPAQFYPFFSGYASESGAGRGRGFNVNMPLPLGTGDEDYCDALAHACARVKAFQPDALVVALGLDTYIGDPLRAFDVTSSGFRAIGRTIGSLRMPTVIVQEGGYLAPELGENLKLVLQAFVDVA